MIKYQCLIIDVTIGSQINDDKDIYEMRRGRVMKKTGVFNSVISKLIAEMGHTDKLAVVDLGFPIPKEVETIDIVLDRGKPDLLETVEVVLRELKVEKILLSEEMKEKNPETLEKLIELIKQKNGEVEVEFLPHEDFKKVSKECKGVVRTGADKPYSNVILVSGVIF